MSITFACANCGKPFTIGDKFAGKKGRCKQCGTVMPIPLASSPSIPTTSSRFDDLYGLDEPPPRLGGGLPPRVEEVEPGSPVAGRLGSRHDVLYPRSRPKASAGGNVIIRIAVGIALALISLAGGGAGLLRLAGINGRGTLEASIQERVALNEQLANVLVGVNDVESARSASPQAVAKIRAISANLRNLKQIKGLKTDIEELKQRYQGPQFQAEQQVIGHLVRIYGIPGGWEALAVQPALDELDVEEKSIPGRLPITAPVIRTPPPIVPPAPLINRGPSTPQDNPVMGPRPNPGRTRTNRKTMTRPGSAGPG